MSYSRYSKNNSRTAKTKMHCIIHFINRLRERYSLELNSKKVKELNFKVQNNQAVYIEKQSNSRSLWEIEYNGIILPCVYNNNLNTVCTVLPKDWRESNFKSSKVSSNDYPDFLGGLKHENRFTIFFKRW